MQGLILLALLGAACANVVSVEDAVKDRCNNAMPEMHGMPLPFGKCSNMFYMCYEGDSEETGTWELFECDDALKFDENTGECRPQEEVSGCIAEFFGDSYDEGVEAPSDFGLEQSASNEEIETPVRTPEMRRRRRSTEETEEAKIYASEENLVDPIAEEPSAEVPVTEGSITGEPAAEESLPEEPIDDDFSIEETITNRCSKVSPEMFGQALPFEKCSDMFYMCYRSKNIVAWILFICDNEMKFDEISGECRTQEEVIGCTGNVINETSSQLPTIESTSEEAVPEESEPVMPATEVIDEEIAEETVDAEPEQELVEPVSEEDIPAVEALPAEPEPVEETVEIVEPSAEPVEEVAQPTETETAAIPNAEIIAEPAVVEENAEVVPEPEQEIVEPVAEGKLVEESPKVETPVELEPAKTISRHRRH